jgi:hypothetical protein
MGNENSNRRSFCALFLTRSVCKAMRGFAASPVCEGVGGGASRSSVTGGALLTSAREGPLFLSEWDFAKSFKGNNQ